MRGYETTSYGHGSFAEYVTAPARALVRKPAELDHLQAAAVPLAGLTPARPWWIPPTSGPASAS